MKNINIYLIGMMGSGKTTIGEKLSKKLNMNFIDTDDKIEKIMSMNIKQIFDEFGEKRYREMETSYFVEKSKEKGIIFSTGGGIVLNKHNRNILLNDGITFLLDTSVNQIVKRINCNTKRPLLFRSKNFEIELKKIWNIRKDLYYRSSNNIIKTDKSKPEIITNKIIKILNEKN